MTCQRPSWDDYFMTIAKIVASRSTCDRLRAGAVLVKNKRIISTGYNGAPPGMAHCDSEAGHKLEEGHCIRTVHAEENCILQVAAVGGVATAGSTLYTVASPCYHCFKKIAVGGVKRIVAGAIYRASDIVEWCKEAGIEFVLYEPAPGWSEHASEIVAAPLRHVTEDEAKKTAEVAA
ncbi:MAG: dCMP deaminase family protein [Patescibacteria group bacterium]|nr:dCMP deaminase family protein [Patescibacteria group bacterium]